MTHYLSRLGRKNKSQINRYAGSNCSGPQHRPFTQCSFKDKPPSLYLLFPTRKFKGDLHNERSRFYENRSLLLCILLKTNIYFIVFDLNRRTNLFSFCLVLDTDQKSVICCPLHSDTTVLLSLTDVNHSR